MAIDIFGPFADAEEVLRTFLVGKLPTNVLVVSATGPTLTPPTVMARRIGGQNDRITDYSIMLVSVFCGTRPESIAMAADIQAHILNAVNVAVPLSSGGTALIDNAVVAEADHPELYDNPDLRHVISTYELRMRRPRPA